MSCPHCRKREDWDGPPKGGCHFGAPEAGLTAFDGKRYCDFTLPAEMKAVWDEARREQFMEELAVRIEGLQGAGDPIDLDGITIPADFSLLAGASIASLTCRETVFMGLADFTGLNTEGGADFTRAHFMRGATFLDANFKGQAAGPERKLGAGRTTPKRVCFDKALFDGDAMFGTAWFGCDVSFADTEFQGSAYFQQARFGGSALFRGPKFAFGARFEEAAFLRGAHFRGTDDVPLHFALADFRGAFLGSAEFKRANFFRAQLRGADLSEANLSGARELLATQLAGTDVTAAKLPDDIKSFSALDFVAETSKQARNIFLLMLAGCVYGWLTIATTADGALIANSSSSNLPVIDAPVPIAGFYWAAPAVLLALFIYFHMYLQRLWEALSQLPAVLPDGKPLHQHAYPWLLNGLVRAHFPRLRRDRPAHARFEYAVSVALAWWVVPASIALFWGRYLWRHDWWGTALQGAMVLGAGAVSIAAYRLARATLRGMAGPEGGNRRWWRREGLWAGLSFALIAAILVTALSARGIATLPADLRGADLRKADLKGVDLRHADMFEANLTGADLRNARFDSAFMPAAILRDAFIGSANFSGATMWRADFRGARMGTVTLTGARLFQADLRGVSGLDCAALRQARQWRDSYRDKSLACGAKIPEAPAE